MSLFLFHVLQILRTEPLSRELFISLKHFLKVYKRGSESRRDVTVTCLCLGLFLLADAGRFTALQITELQKHDGR